MKLEIGSEYIINHRRKGTFVGKILTDGEVWCEIQITKGKADYISIKNNLQGKGNIGDELTIRKSFCTFEKVNKQ